MPTKQIALGSLVKVDETNVGTFTAVGLSTSITPPPESTAKIDVTALEDTLATNEGGIDEQSEFSFEHFWHPKDANHEILDTLRKSKAKVPWQVIFPFATPVTDQFTGWVSALTPAPLNSSGTIKRTVTVQRTSAIVRT